MILKTLSDFFLGDHIFKDSIVALHHMQHWHLLALDGEHAVSIPGTGGGGIPVIEYNRYVC